MEFIQVLYYYKFIIKLEVIITHYICTCVHIEKKKGTTSSICTLTVICTLNF